jgi:hypothetical protein
MVVLHFGLYHDKLPYILAYKSINFGRNLAKILSIRLTRGSHFYGLKKAFFINYLSVLSLFSKFKEDKKN